MKSPLMNRRRRTTNRHRQIPLATMPVTSSRSVPAKVATISDAPESSSGETASSGDFDSAFFDHDIEPSERGIPRIYRARISRRITDRFVSFPIL